MKMLMLCVHDRVTVGKKGDENVFLGMKESVSRKYKMSLSRNMQPYLGGNHATTYAVALACPHTGLDPHAISMPDCHT